MTKISLNLAKSASHSSARTTQQSSAKPLNKNTASSKTTTTQGYRSKTGKLITPHQGQYVSQGGINTYNYHKTSFHNPESKKSIRLQAMADSLKAFGVKEYDPRYFYNPRYQAALMVKEVVEDKRSLTVNLNEILDAKDVGFASELAYGVLRYLPQLTFIANKLLTNPLKPKNYFAFFILLQGLYQLMYMNRAEHAAVNENVELTKKIYGVPVSQVINACLRNFLRNETELVAASKTVPLLPKWLQKSLEQRIPSSQLEPMLQAMNQKPPLWLRVNSHKVSVANFLAELTAAGHEYFQHPHLQTAILIKQAVPVTSLPGFEQGYFSVQDLHAQFASVILTQPIEKIADATGNTLLSLTPYIDVPRATNITASKSHKDTVILDSCCSPGGKTTHLLDLLPRATMIANDIDDLRLKRVHENLARQQQQATVINGDARYPELWLDHACDEVGNSSHKIDLIILDIPCSGTGVIRRHPDIKWLRRKDDIANLNQTQLEILQQTWDYLDIGGKLLYTSCSILGEENEQMIAEFLSNTVDACLIDLENFAQANILPNSERVELQGPGLQLLNGALSGDGFYYCLLTKTDPQA